MLTYFFGNLHTDFSSGIIPELYLILLYCESPCMSGFFFYDAKTNNYCVKNSKLEVIFCTVLKIDSEYNEYGWHRYLVFTIRLYLLCFVYFRLQLYVHDIT